MIKTIAFFLVQQPTTRVHQWGINGVQNFYKWGGLAKPKVFLSRVIINTWVILSAWIGSTGFCNWFWANGNGCFFLKLIIKPSHFCTFFTAVKSSLIARNYREYLLALFTVKIRIHDFLINYKIIVW